MKKFPIGTFIRTEDNRSGFITGTFSNKVGTFYQLDEETSLNNFIFSTDIISIAKMTTVIKKTKKRSRKPMPENQAALLISETEFEGTLEGEA